MKLKITPMAYQQDALCDFSTRFLGVSGGKRSGKSRMMSVYHAIMLSSIHPGKPGLVASPVYGMTRRNLIPLFREASELLGIEIEGVNTKSPDCLKINWNGQISTIWLDCTIENYNRLNGLSLAWACVDEVDKARYSDVEAFIEELVIRISNPAPGKTAQICMTGAPELNGYMAEFFIEKSAPNKKLHKWSMMQNEMLSDEYKKSILDTIPENKQQGWVYGEFMYNTDGLVYDSFDPKANHTDLTIKDIHPIETIDVTWDINQGGCNVTFSVKRGVHTFIFMEWAKMHSTEAVIAKIEKQTWAKQCVLTCDPACTQVFPYIQKAKASDGTPIRNKIMKSAPLIEWRVTALNLQFGGRALINGVPKPLLMINTKACPVTTRCLMRQSYVKGEPDKKTWIEDAGTDISGPVDGIGYRNYRDHPYNPLNPSKPILMRGF